MFELLGSGVLGSLLGGAFRLAPEVLKFFDRANERRHELMMFQAQCDLEKQRGDQKLQEIGAQREAAVDVGVMDAFNAVINQQTEMAKAAGGWVAALSASVRPVMTYYLLAMYGLYKAAMFVAAPSDGWAAMLDIYGPQDMALLCGVVNYWIMDRTLAKRGL